MARLNFYERSKNYAPADLTANSTDAIWGVTSGDLVGPSFCLVNTAFDGSNGDATASLGDGGDVDRFITTTNSGITTADTEPQIGTGGSSSTYAGIGIHLYTAADTIDVTFVADTAADGSTGEIDFWLYVAKVFPGGTS